MALDLSNIKSIVGLSGKTIKEVRTSSGKVLWKAGAIVTYIVDSGVTKYEEVDTGVSCLAPTTFTPTKSGWTFAGWRKDSTASANVETSVVMEGEPITLYAVFKKACKANFVSYSSSNAQYMTDTVSEYAYYNNGNVKGFDGTAPTGHTYSGWIWRGWSGDGVTTTNASVALLNGSYFYCGDNTSTTFYGLYEKTITVTYYDNKSAPSYAKDTRYFNAAGNMSDATFKLTQIDDPNWSERGWSTTNKGDASITYANGATFTRESNITLYGLYQQTITVGYTDNNGRKTTTGTRYWAPAGYIDPSFKLSQQGASGWTNRGWSITNKGDASITYNDGATFTRSSNAELYALYEKVVQLNYYDATYSGQYKSGMKYWAPAGEINPSFTMTQTAMTGWTALGWATDYTAPDNAVVYSNGATITINNDMTIYGRYSQAITLTYAGNGATGGSTASHSETRHYNAPNRYGSATFTLKANGFTRNGYTFNGWDLGAVGAKITLSANKTATAKWTDNAWTWVSNYVGSGDTLTVTITYANNALSLSAGDKLSRFDVASYHEDDLESMDVDFKTNTVSTRGCKYMTVTNPDFFFGQNTDGEIRNYVRVMSSSGAKLKEWTDRVYGGSHKIDVSSASHVYIVGIIGAWGQSQSPNARVQGISFSNS